MFALVDCNNFYVSCERIFNPALCGRPAVVLSNNDGCFIARSEEAKAIGLGMGAPAFKSQALLRRHNVAVYSANFALYGDMSARVMNTLATFSPDIEIYSIDECFLGLDGFGRFDLEGYAREICRTVHRHTGIPVSIGIGPTKTLAKAANRMAKKNPVLAGVAILRSEADIHAALGAMAVEHVWGIGNQYAAFLHERGVHTALDLARLPAPWVRRHLHITGARVQEELNGRSCLALELVRPSKQTICTSRSFGTPVSDYDGLLHAVAHFTSKCAFKLRREGSKASLLTVFACTSPFAPKKERYWGTRTIGLGEASSDAIVLLAAAERALACFFREGYGYRKAGVIVAGMVPCGSPGQMELALFDTVPLPEKQISSGIVMEALDRLNARYGPGTVRLASDVRTGWKQRQELLSPQYTTSWNDIIEVKA
ncbi:MAG: Y-family DNA polymerase [Chlorobiaceae bacterium]|nr:Y-family DNA polymerase [Chlorobiaceae bacterium]NTV60364.1 Y-family DNA polymerase [Chlorobiaceae bacterium]